MTPHGGIESAGGGYSSTGGVERLPCCQTVLPISGWGVLERLRLVLAPERDSSDMAGRGGTVCEEWRGIGWCTPSLDSDYPPL
jgi:hypothetical protein